MSRPTRVKIGAFTFKILYTPHIDDVGSANQDKLELYINPDGPADIVRSTVWHEIQHAACWVVGLHARWEAEGGKSTPPTEEDVVDPLSNVEYDIMRRNAGLMEWLMEKP